MALTVGELNAVLSVDDRAVRPALRRAEQAMRQAGQQMGNDADRAGRQAGQQLADGIANAMEGITRNAERAGREAGERLGGGFVRGADGQWRDLRGRLVDAVTAATLEAEAQARRGGQQAGQQAGEQLGDGIVRGADGRLRDARGRFVSAGRAAGDAAGDGLADGIGEGADDAVDQAGGRLERLKAVAGGAAMAAGAAAGALLVSAMGEALDQGRLTGRLQAQLGTTPAVAKRYGRIAGELFKAGIVENFEEGTQVLRAAASSGLFPPDATNRQLESISRKIADVGKTFDFEFAEVAQAAGIAVKTGLAKNTTEALDMISRGLSGLGPAGEDFLETITEYGVQFAKSGLSGRTAMGLMRQAIQAGWKDTDKLADAFKELELRITAGEKAQVEALQSLGLNAQQIIDDVSAGGARGEKAMGQVLDAIVKLGPESNDAKVAIQELFGGPGEDLGSALFELNMSKARQAMGDTKGEADKLGEALRGNLGAKITAAKNTMQQNLVDFLNGPVYGALSRAKQWLGSLWSEAGKDGQQGVDRVVSFFELLGRRLLEKAGELAPRAIEAISGIGQKIAEFIMANPMQTLKIAAIAGAILMGLSMLPALIAAGIGATVFLIVSSFVGKLIEITIEKLPEWWDTFTNWISEKASQVGTFMAVLGTALGVWFAGLWQKYIAGPVGRQWDAFLTTVRQLPSRATGALSALGSALATKASQAWQQFQNAAAQKASQFIGWVKGLPGRISASVGSLGSLLYGKGRDVVLGLWRGISSMGGWLRSTLMSWARRLIPGPIAKALGIASPSRVMRDQIGRWIPAGVVQGIEAHSRQVDRAMADLVRVPSSMTSLVETPSGSWDMASARVRAGAAQRVVLELRSSGRAEDDYLVERMRRGIRKRGGGDVGLVLAGRRSG